MNIINIMNQHDQDAKQFLIDHQDERTKAERWNRVMGYHRPIESWNVGKQQEFKDRKYFTNFNSEKINDNS